MMHPKMVQQQSQKLVLSPQIRQYLKLLQLPLAELQQTVETALAENPVLEEKTDRTAPETEAQPQETADPKSDEAPSSSGELDFRENFDKLMEYDESLAQNNEASNLSVPHPGSTQKLRDYQESLLTQPEALADFLTWQIRFLELSPEETALAEQIIGNIDTDGYLQATLDEIAKSAGYPQAMAEKVLAEIQELDPPGIGARNLKEALLLQLDRLPHHDAALAVRMVSEHLDLLEKRDLAGLAKALDAHLSDIKSASELIGRLDPKPGRTFYGGQSQTVIPDATVTFSEEDDKEALKVEVHEDGLPELRISPTYRRLLRSPGTDEKTRAYIQEKLQAAIDFMRAMQMRKSTLSEITDKIVKSQAEFFEKGFSHLHPLRLKDISEKIGIHESTVSRAIQGKYMSTPQGLIPYKSFFSSKLESTTGEAESQKSIMERIRALIAKEEPKKPLSDQALL
ncbi:MAG: RNA polymerase factor sigma-54, partial [Candidatus Omnitrophota bacterium]